jgi:hypothetical protein
MTGLRSKVLPEEQPQMDLVKIPRGPEKEVFTVRSGDQYFAFITGADDIFLIDEPFKSPLVASNKARALKRQHKIQVNLKNTKKPVTKSKLQPKCVLYTEAEVAKLTHLRFRETWLICAPQGGFVSEVMQNDKVVEYTKEYGTAKAFKSYEDASDYVKTLDMVIKKGHTLRRYFTRTDLN